MEILKNSLSNRIILILSLLFLLSISLSSVKAADVNMNSTNNTIANVVENQTNNGDTIHLDEGTYDHSHLNGTDGININKNLTIIGKDPKTTIIDAQKLGRIFNITTGSTLTLINITLINGNITGDGGAIYNNFGKVTIINCTFNNNTATRGGVIYNNGANFIISNSSFNDNTATNTGGVICNTGANFIISNSTFSNNTATNDSGVIYNNGANFIISNSSFNDNTAIRYGGVIYNRGANFLITNSTFNKNNATRGGVIYNNGVNFTMSNSTFNNNSAINGSGPNGGVISNDNSANFTISNSTFNENTANVGGVIYNLHGPNFIISNSTFNNNIATTDGGVIYNYYGVNFTISNSTFNNNKPTSGYGGVMYNYNGFITISNSSFINNTSVAGGVIYNAGNCSISNSTFNNNTATAGGVIYNTGNFNITNSTFNNNKATSTGGGVIYNYGGVITISNSTFNNNKATTSDGGVIYNRGANFIISNSSFNNNTATRYGGVLCNLNGANFTISNSTFNNHNATYGGVIANRNGANFTISNSTFNKNNATEGGAIYNSGVNCTVTNSSFTNNKATSYGGGIYNTALGSMLVSNNTMTDNTAGALNGGNVIYNLGSMGILNLTYLDNSTKDVTIGDNITLNATLVDDMGNPITGQNITFYVNGVLIGNATSIEGKASFNYKASISSGIKQVNGTYVGIGTYSINIAEGQLRINKINVNSTIVVPNNVTVGQKINITGVLTDEDGNAVGGVELNVTVGNETFIVITNSDGIWSLLYTTHTGDNFTVTVSLIDNDIYSDFINSTNLNINKINLTSTIVVPDNVTVDQEINITGVLTDEDGNAVGGVELNVTVGNETFVVITNSDGTWNLFYSPNTAGNLSITVSLTNNDIYNDFSNSTDFTVNKIYATSTIVVPGVVKVGKTINITGVATDKNGNPLSNTDLNVTIDGKTFIVTTDSNGRWILPYKPTRTGNIDASVSWAGSDKYNGFISSVEFNVQKGNITVTITVTENDDGSITLVANATDEDGDPVVNYPVDFFLDGNIVGQATTDSNGLANITIPANKISDGLHIITVIVVGSDNFNEGIASIEFLKTSEDINTTNDTNKTNNDNNNNNRTATSATMKETGIPIIVTLLVLLSSLELIIRKK